MSVTAAEHVLTSFEYMRFILTMSQNIFSMKQKTGNNKQTFQHEVKKTNYFLFTPKLQDDIGHYTGASVGTRGVSKKCFVH